MKIEHAGKHNLVFTQDEKGHRIPYSCIDSDVPQNVLDYVVEHDLWNDDIKALYAADNPEPTADEIQQRLVETADQFVLCEMSIADKAINAHTEGAARVVSTKTKWINYKNKLRDYVQKIEGSRQIVGTKPIRPI